MRIDIPEPANVKDAIDLLNGIANKTPVFTSRTLDDRVNGHVFLKCENFQRAGAFKFRGAFNAISRLSESEKRAGVITHSSGNHAQGVALAASLLSVTAVIVMPEDAPEIKRQATLQYGAEIVPCKAIEREIVTTKLVEEHGYTLIHPYDNHDVIAGQGTAAWELFDEVGELDLLFVPVGGGGLISGSALAAVERSPSCRVVGVEPEAGNDANRSWREGRIHTLSKVPDTLADGLRTRHVGIRNLQVMRDLVSDMTTVKEEEIVESLQFIWTRLKIVVEPSAAAALAPCLSGRYPVDGKRIGVILSGGNADLRLLQLLQPSPSEQITPAKPEAINVARPVVLVTEEVSEKLLAELKPLASLRIQPNLSGAALRTAMAGVDAMLVGNKTRINGQDIEYAHKLRVIATTANRLDNIDVSAARAQGVEICYSPDSMATALSEHIIGIMLNLSSGAGNRGQDQGLVGKTLGIVGFGSIGRELARRAQAFSMNVIVNQPRLTPELALSEGVETADLSHLLATSDFVSLNVPLSAGTNVIIGAGELARMKPSSYLINTAHTDLIDYAALSIALDEGTIAGVALATFRNNAESRTLPPETIRSNPRFFLARHITSFRPEQNARAHVNLARQVAERLRATGPSQTLSLDILPVNRILPHEEIDDKRVGRLMNRLEHDGKLVNPPVVAPWGDKYIVLDGATRFSALGRLGYSHIIAQIVHPETNQFDLHTWYHVVSSSRLPSSLWDHLGRLDDLALEVVPSQKLSTIFNRKDVICYFLDRSGKATIAIAQKLEGYLDTLRTVVAAYTKWGQVERTLITDPDRLRAQFPQMIAVAVFPQIQPEIVFKTASQGQLMPAGLTRFVIPGRILRLNADLSRLGRAESLGAKRAWLNQVLEDKLARSRLRYYSEPVVLLDE